MAADARLVVVQVVGVLVSRARRMGGAHGAMDGLCLARFIAVFFMAFAYHEPSMDVVACALGDGIKLAVGYFDALLSMAVAKLVDVLWCGACQHHGMSHTGAGFFDGVVGQRCTGGLDDGVLTMA